MCLQQTLAKAKYDFKNKVDLRALEDSCQKVLVSGQI